MLGKDWLMGGGGGDELSPRCYQKAAAAAAVMGGGVGSGAVGSAGVSPGKRESWLSHAMSAELGEENAARPMVIGIGTSDRAGAEIKFAQHGPPGVAEQMGAQMEHSVAAVGEVMRSSVRRATRGSLTLRDGMMEISHKLKRGSLGLGNSGRAPHDSSEKALPRHSEGIE